MKISGVYKITNTVTGDFYIGSSKDVKLRWANHKCQSTWKKCPNKQLYKDMHQYGVDKFEFEILEEVESEQLKEKEQKFIEKMHPVYNDINANGWNVERYKEHKREHYQQNRERYKKQQKEYQKSDKGKESHRKANKKYHNQLCSYNGEVLKLCALQERFSRARIAHPTKEAKKYIIKN